MCDQLLWHPPPLVFMKLVLGLTHVKCIECLPQPRLPRRHKRMEGVKTDLQKRGSVGRQGEG